MIEVVKGTITIPGDPPSRANIQMDYRLKNVPLHKIKNKNLKAQKLKWLKTNEYKDHLAWIVQQHASCAIPKGHAVYVAMKMFFLYKKKGGIVQDLRKDIDNVEKLVNDALEKSGVIDDDKRICLKIVEKAVVKEHPRLEIYSIAGVENVSENTKTEWIRNVYDSFLQS